MRIRYVCSVALAIGITLSTGSLQARNKKTKSEPPRDRIEVVGHVPLGETVRRFVATRHYSSYYLYAEMGASSGAILIDVTKPAQPQVLANVPYSSSAGTGELYAVAGTAALVAGEPANPPSSVQTIRIMDFSDPKQPKVAREFTGVTAISRDDRRGLIFVANGEGLWILHQELALDPQVEEEYAHHVIYDH